MSIEVDKVVNDEVSVDVQKRAFMSKFGKYAAVSVGMATLMTPTLSTAGNYCRHGGNHVGIVARREARRARRTARRARRIARRTARNNQN